MEVHLCGCYVTEEKGERSKGGYRGSNRDKGANLHVECGMQTSFPTDFILDVFAMWLCHALVLGLPFDQLTPSNLPYDSENRW